MSTFFSQQDDRRNDQIQTLINIFHLITAIIYLLEALIPFFFKASPQLPLSDDHNQV